MCGVFYGNETKGAISSYTYDIGNGYCVRVVDFDSVW